MKTVLFVDDEPCLLRGLKRSLRPVRKLWNLIFAEGGTEALKCFENEKIDAVICDMRMPNMTGSELIRQVQADYPTAIRIGLSGHSESDQLVDSCGTFQQFWRKPCSTESMISTLRRCFYLGDRLSDSSQRAVCELETLPCYVTTTRELIAQLDHPEPDLQEVFHLVHQDLGLFCLFSKLFNTSFLGSPRELNNTSDLMLSLSQFRDIFSDCRFTESPQPGPCLQFSSLKDHDYQLGRSALKAARLMKTHELIQGLDFDEQEVACAYLACLWGFPEDIVDALDPEVREQSQIYNFILRARNTKDEEPIAVAI